MAISNSNRTSLASRLIRAAAISSTHQLMAFDAAGSIEGKGCVQWRRLFLRHAQIFALGADAPDVEFRDFRNHVLYPDAKFWGGAPAKAQCWYRNLVTALTKREWKNAVYCAGVLSHYLSDAVHPLHTDQSAADNDIATALDLTTRVTYVALRRAAGPAAVHTAVLGTGPEFLIDAMHAGANAAHASYAALIAHFDLERADGDASTGLDAAGRVIMAATIARATGLIAAVLQRAIEDSGVEEPEVPLAACVAQALVAWPIVAMSNWWQKRALKRLVAVMADEISTTGHVAYSLPEAIRVKRDCYAKEVLQTAVAAPSGGNVVQFQPARSSPLRENEEEVDAEVIEISRQRRPMEPPRPAPGYREASSIRSFGAPQMAVAPAEKPASAPAVSAGEADAVSGHVAALGHAAAAMLGPSSAGSVSNFRDRRATSQS